MSKPLNQLEFEQLRRRWMRSFAPVSNREQSRWDAAWNTNIEELPYLLMSKTSRGPLDDMLQIRLSVGPAFTSFDMIKIDFEHIWSTKVAASKQACHTIVNRAEGFDVLFCDRNEQDNYITGSVCVRQEVKS